MTDLTPLLSSLLPTHNARTHHHPSQPSDPFLQEAYKINTHITSLHSYLLSTRPSYLSLAPPSSRPTANRQHLTNPQRDAIDTSSKTLLRDLNASITQLDTAETFRRQIAEQKLKKRRPGALLRWARGNEDGEGEGAVEPAEETARMWRGSVMLYLKEGLKRAGSVLEGMMERRVEREVEKRRSVLYMSPGREGVVDAVVGSGTKGGRGVVEVEEEERKREMEGLSEEQVQMLERENGELMRGFEDQLSQVRYAFFLSLPFPFSYPFPCPFPSPTVTPLLVIPPF